MTRAKRRGRAYARASRRHERAYATQMSKKRPGFFDDWRFIWSSRTYHGQKRSWLQKLFRW